MRCFPVVITAVLIVFLSGCMKKEIPAYVKNREEKKAEEITVFENKSEKYDFLEKKEKAVDLTANVIDLEKEIEQFENIEKNEMLLPEKN